MSSYKLRPYSELPGILKAAARTAWDAAGATDGYLYKTLSGSLIERLESPEMPDEAYVWSILDPANLIH